MKTVTVLKVDYVCFIKHKLNWERKKVHRLLFMLWHVFHGKQLLVWNFTTKHTKCGLQLCTFLLLYITCGNVKGSCWIVRMGEGDCAASHNSIRKQLCNCLQFYRCSLWEEARYERKQGILYLASSHTSHCTPSLWRWNSYRVPKRRPITIWHHGNTQKKIYKIWLKSGKNNGYCTCRVTDSYS